MILEAINELISEQMKFAVRNLRSGEKLPAGAFFGFDGRSLEEDWVWIATAVNGSGVQSIVAALVACPCHGLVFLARLVVLPKYGFLLPRLLRAFLRDSLSRGYSGYVCYLGKKQAKLARILERTGAISFPEDPAVCYGGKLSDLVRW